MGTLPNQLVGDPTGYLDEGKGLPWITMDYTCLLRLRAKVAQLLSDPINNDQFRGCKRGMGGEKKRQHVQEKCI